MKNKYTFTAEMWVYPGMAGNWHFISLPKEVAHTVQNTHGAHSRGWGSLPVEVKIGKTIWETSIFPDKKSGTYLLPIKARVRKLEDIYAGDKVKIMVTIRV
jgi:hypothetical protein